MVATAQLARQGAARPDRFEDYVPVAERLEKFYERFPGGRIVTAIVEHDQVTGFVLMRAELYRNHDDAEAAASGHAFEVRGESHVNKSHYIENAETSSVGRALTLLGFEAKRRGALPPRRGKIEMVSRVEAQATSVPRGSHLKEAPPAGQTYSLADYRERIKAWRKKICEEGVETESVLNEILGGEYGCTQVEELNPKQAEEYEGTLQRMYEEHEANKRPSDY